MDAEKRRILGIGGANLDIHASLKAPAAPGDSNPSRFRMSAGGVMRNILEDLSLLGESCVLMSAVGRDPFAGKILASCEAAGIDRSPVYVSPELSSSCYVDLLEPGGEMVIACSDMEVIESMPLSHIEANAGYIKKARAIAVDGNLTREQLEAVIALAPPEVPVFADPVSAAKVMRFDGLLGRLALFKPNALELEKISGIPCGTLGPGEGPDRKAIARAADGLLSQGLERIAVSLGRHGCYFADTLGQSFFCRLDSPLTALNTTGAGDAFMAGMMSGLLCGLSAKDAAARALACGALTSATPLTIDPALSAAAIDKLIQTSEIHLEVI